MTKGEGKMKVKNKNTEMEYDNTIQFIASSLWAERLEQGATTVEGWTPAGERYLHDADVEYIEDMLGREMSDDDAGYIEAAIEDLAQMHRWSSAIIDDNATA